MDLAIEQVLSQIIAFLIMLWVLKIFFWKPVLGVLEERKHLIASEFDQIEQKKLEIKQLVEEYKSKLQAIDSEARLKMQEAIERGQKLALDIELEARDNATHTLNRTREEVKKEIAQAKALLKEDIAKISLAISEKLLKESLSPEMHNKIINQAIEEINVK